MAEKTSQLGHLYAAIRQKITLLYSSGIMNHEELLTAFIDRYIFRNHTFFVTILRSRRWYGGDQLELELLGFIRTTDSKRYLFTVVYIDFIFYLAPEEVFCFMPRREKVGLLQRWAWGGGGGAYFKSRISNKTWTTFFKVLPPNWLKHRMYGSYITKSFLP